MGKATEDVRLCPDTGVCHHDCKGRHYCFRVECCAPLSLYGEDWTEAQKSASANERHLNRA